MEEKNFDKLILYFSDKIRSALEKVSIKDQIQEIRLRAEKPLSVTSFGKELFITENGGISSSPSIGLAAGKRDVEYSFKAVCEYSVHSFQKELSQGYITLPGGHRVGLCGSAVIKDGKMETIKHISGMNFRIANEVKGCADEIMKILFASKIVGTLIIGPPLSGKTTFLRDLCRQLGNLRKVSLIDERGEIASVYQGIPQNDVGICTDVFDGYQKEDGMAAAIRSMSPEIIVVDEIGGLNDCMAIERCSNAGVVVIASAHAGSFEELDERKHIRALLDQRIFSQVVLLGNREKPGVIKDIKEVQRHAENIRNAADYHNYGADGNYILKKVN